MTEKPAIDPTLHAELHLLDSMPERDPQAIAQGRAQFIAQAQSLTAAVSDQPNRRHNTWIQSIFRKKENKSMFTAIASFIVALTLAFGGAGATVYAAQDSLPNDFLYPVKTFSEDFQLAFQNDDLDELTMLGSFAQRRLSEINALMKDGQDVPPDTIIRLERQIASMFSLAAGLEGDEMQGALEQIRTMLQQGDQERFMAGQGDQIPEEIISVEILPEESLEVVEDAAKETLRNIWRVTNNDPEGEKDIQNAFRERFDSAENHPGDYPDKIPGAGTENGAQTGVGSCDVEYLTSIGVDATDIAAVAEVCECEGYPDMDITDLSCILIPIWDGSGSFGSGSNAPGDSGSGGSGSGGSEGGNSP